jgi:hypothetical protein
MEWAVRVILLLGVGYHKDGPSRCLGAWWGCTKPGAARMVGVPHRLVGDHNFEI